MMDANFVQFSDDGERVIAIFSTPQDVGDYPNQGEVSEDDPRYIKFITPDEPEVINPIDKLKAFLLANPDVAEILK